MALEIERKFLVRDNSWTDKVTERRYLRQGYLHKNDEMSIRIRIDGTHAATLTIKTAAPGIVRNEYEYMIPVVDAEALLCRCNGVLITKVRHLVLFGTMTWEVDVFEGENTGLVIAEIELSAPDQSFQRPPWLGEEVTLDRSYYNANLAHRPFSCW